MDYVRTVVSTLILSIIVRVIKNGELKLSLVDAYLSKKRGGFVTPEPAKVSTPESRLAAPGLNAHHDQIVFITPSVPHSVSWHVPIIEPSPSISPVSTCIKTK